ncbi:hypothetical protein K7X08_018271 [Anisodus acutangulus]|uniref:Uncharacterized protein n=1 Tax=Anisodus acutangulus TaxID=402998 RepID=A0A9Q1M029_9SOLA|nr:hypothetical protein K7X08_018271 [Anisodus acutangulus]
MAALSSKPNHIRSISLPGRSHPTTQRVEEELNKLKSLEVSVAPKADTVYNGLLGLEKLYKCIDDLLNLPQTLSQSLDAKRVDDLLDKSVRLLDVCGTTREHISQLKKIKKIKRDAKILVLTLKQMDQETVVPVFLDADEDTIAAIRALREANAVCISIFQMLLSFLCVPLLKPKQSKWSLLSRLVHKDRIAPEVQEENTSLETRLETFEACLHSFENALEDTFSLPFALLVVPHGDRGYLPSASMCMPIMEIFIPLSEGEKETQVEKPASQDQPKKGKSSNGTGFEIGAQGKNSM